MKSFFFFCFFLKILAKNKNKLLSIRDIAASAAIRGISNSNNKNNVNIRKSARKPLNLIRIIAYIYICTDSLSRQVYRELACSFSALKGCL
jgi:hypothetical protein